MKKTLGNLVSVLKAAGVKVGRSSFPGALFMEIPSVCDPAMGVTIEGKEGAKGLLYPLLKKWEVMQYERRFVSGKKLLQLVRDNVPDSWSEFVSPSFSDLVKDPARLSQLAGPRECVKDN